MAKRSTAVNHNWVSGEGEAGSPSNTSVAWAEVYLHTKWHLDPSSRLVTIDIGRKVGDTVPLFMGQLDSGLIQCDQGRALPPYQVASWSFQPFGHNTWAKSGGCCAPFLGRRSGSACNTVTMSPQTFTFTNFCSTFGVASRKPEVEINGGWWHLRVLGWNKLETWWDVVQVWGFYFMTPLLCPIDIGHVRRVGSPRGNRKWK